jgi:hypothetical protein
VLSSLSQNNVNIVAVTPPRKAMPNDWAFGTDLTNIDNKWGQVGLNNSEQNQAHVVCLQHK